MVMSFTYMTKLYEPINDIHVLVVLNPSSRLFYGVFRRAKKYTDNCDTFVVRYVILEVYELFFTQYYKMIYTKVDLHAIQFVLPSNTEI